MTNDVPATDGVQGIAAAIARLRPEEKQQLFSLLAARGELPSDLAVGKSPTPVQPQLLTVLARPTRPPDYVLTFDGGSKGNPGLGYGSYAIMRTQDGAQRLERLEFGDGYTNNEAEYDTLIVALGDLIGRIEEAGRRSDEFALEVRGDSALVINQLQGKWKAKDPRMRRRRNECTRLLQNLGSVDLKAQPRQESVRILGH